MDVNDICDLNSEAGVVASLVFHPDYVYLVEQLNPRHFTNQTNSWLFYALKQLEEHNIHTVDAYNILNILRSQPKLRAKVDSVLNERNVEEFISTATSIARNTPEDYRLAAESVLNMAFRRATYQKLSECQNICQSMTEKEIVQTVWKAYRRA